MRTSVTGTPSLASAALDSLQNERGGQPFGPPSLMTQRDLFTQPDSDTAECASTATSESQPISRRSTSSPEASRVKTSALPGKERGWPEAAVAFSLNSYAYWRSLGLNGSYLKTSLAFYPVAVATNAVPLSESCGFTDGSGSGAKSLASALSALHSKDCARAIKAATLPSSFKGWSSAGTASRGGFSTLNILESPKDAAECSLSDILQETRAVPARFYLSAKACAGILRRSERRGVTLPSALRDALTKGGDPTTDQYIVRPVTTHTSGGSSPASSPYGRVERSEQWDRVEDGASARTRRRGTSSSPTLCDQGSGCVGGNQPLSLVTHALTAEGFDASEDGSGRGTPIVAGTIPSLNRRAGRSEHQPLIAQIQDVNGTRLKRQNGVGIDLEAHTGYTLTARDRHAVAYTLRQNERNNSNPACANYVSGADGMIESVYADAYQADATETLHAVRRETGEEAFSGWGFGVAISLQQAHLLRPVLYVGSVRREDAEVGRLLVNRPLSREEGCPAWAVREVWQAGRDGRTPRRWRLQKQHADQLRAHLSRVSYSRTSAARFLRALWQASEGLGLLRQALSEIQEIWRPASDESQPARASSCVRRLTPAECESLQGFPRHWTCVTRLSTPPSSGPLDVCPSCEFGPDSHRYRGLGNAVAIPLVEWIFKRINDCHGPL